MSKEKKNKLRDIIKAKIMPLIKPSKGEMVDSVRVKIASNIAYLQEISTGKIICTDSEYKMLRMNKKELENCQIINKSGKLVYKNNLDKIASTIGLTSKEQENSQAFVMGKDGALYMATHIGKFIPNVLNPNLSHASFLGGRPAELAGLMSINEEGKIVQIVNNSGHYLPESLDMYRGIKKLGKDIFASNAIVVIGKKKETFANFIQQMESIQVNGKALHENLRDDRISKIKNEISVKGSLGVKTDKNLGKYGAFIKNANSSDPSKDEVKYDVFYNDSLFNIARDVVNYDAFDSSPSLVIEKEEDKENFDSNKDIQYPSKKELAELAKNFPIADKENNPIKANVRKTLRADKTPMISSKRQILKLK
jgi:hypothetical protein